MKLRGLGKRNLAFRHLTAKMRAIVDANLKAMVDWMEDNSGEGSKKSERQSKEKAKQDKSSKS